LSRPASLTWLAAHEFRLSWRDWLSMLTAGGRSRMRTATVALAVFAAFMHLYAYWIVAGYAQANLAPDIATLIGVTGTLVLIWSLLLSQAMESVTRAFYTRSDLDLILTAPAPARKVFAVRMGRIAGSVMALALLLAAPFIDVLAWRGGAGWLAAYGVVAALGAVATTAALALTIALFRTIGARRTRLVAQIVAAVIGAAFVIGLQVVAIFSYGSLSRFAALQSEWMLGHVPGVESVLWWPARAALGSLPALAAVMAASAALLAASIALFAGRFGEHAVAAAGVGFGGVRRLRRSRAFRRRSPAQALRRKEWTLLARDPWLMSQTLMQLLYLLPPALLLWVTFRSGTDTYVVLIPVVVMAAGQLGGGLAWLSISGEDAPDLIGTAPVGARRAVWAKIEAVIGAVAFIFAPLILALALMSPWAGVVTVLGVLCAAGAATGIQLCFRVQAKRSQFRRRQTSSRLATFAEAFSSIAWASTAALAAAGTWIAVITGLMALGILLGARLIGSPSPQA
jgi:ABC-2 type transport system permease protein